MNARAHNCGIGVNCRNVDLDLRSGIRHRPDGPHAADKLGTLAHAREPEVSLTSLGRQNLGVDTSAVIPDSQTKLMLIVAKLDFNLFCLGMPKRIAQGLACDPISLITHNGVQCPRSSFDVNLQTDRSVSSEFLSGSVFTLPTTCGCASLEHV